MKLQLNTPAALNSFTSHGPGYVAVNGKHFRHSVAVTPEQVLTDWQPQDFSALDESHFIRFLSYKPEIVLLGTGTRQRFPQPHLYRQLIAARIGVECMDTAAACRTFNILIAENRKVIAAILL